jgi:hypothetical protein
MKYLLLIGLLFFTSLNAKDIALVKDVSGNVNAKDNNGVIVVQKGNWLSEKMVLSTHDNSSVTLIFKDNSVLSLGSNSILVLEKYVFEPAKKEYDFKLNLEAGSASFESGKIGELSPDSFSFQTPEATVGIRGTKFIVKVQ